MQTRLLHSVVRVIILRPLPGASAVTVETVLVQPAAHIQLQYFDFNATLKVWKRTNSVDSGRHTLIDHATMQEIGTFNITGNPITPGVEAQIRGLLGP